MIRYILGNLRTGRIILDLPVLKGSWDDRLLAAPSISVTVDVNDPDAQMLGLRNVATPAQTFLAVVDGDNILAAGPIWTRTWDASGRLFSASAKGLESYYDHRHILPLLAATLGVDQWTVTDPEDPEAVIPNPALTTSLTGLSLGTIAKRLVQQAHEWTGGNVPVVFLDDESGTHERNYLGVDFKSVGSALRDLANVEGGPEYRFRPRFTSDRLGIEWVFEVGTGAQALLVSAVPHVWDMSRPEAVAFGLTIDEDASDLSSLAWATGGRQSDSILVSRAYDGSLIDAGFPLLETVSTSHSSVSQQATLDGHTRDALSSRPVESWSFTAKAHPIDSDGQPAGPQLGDFRSGDYAEVIIEPWDPATGRGDPYLLDGGTFQHRIVGLSGDVGENVTVQLQTRLE